MSGFKHVVGPPLLERWVQAEAAEDWAELDRIWRTSVRLREERVKARTRRANKNGHGELISHMFLAPSVRVVRVMKRLSRDRILYPKEVEEIGHRLVVMTGAIGSSGITAAYNASVEGPCLMVGMYKGEPLVDRSDPGYKELLEIFSSRHGRIGRKMSEREKTRKTLSVLQLICGK